MESKKLSRLGKTASRVDCWRKGSDAVDGMDGMCKIEDLAGGGTK